MGKGERKGDWGMGVWKKNGCKPFHPIPHTLYPIPLHLLAWLFLAGRGVMLVQVDK